MGASPPLAQPHSTSRPKRQRHALLVFGVFSLVLHAVLLDALPGFDAPDIPRARVLEVMLVSPPVTPVATPEFAPPAATPQAAPPPKRSVERPSKPLARADKRQVVEEKTGKTPPPAPPAAPRESMIEEMGSAPASPSPAPPPSREPDIVTNSAPTLPAPVTPPAFDASYLRNPAPRYPLIARRNGEQGTVTLRVLVARNGTPSRVTVEQTSGSRHLDEAALEAVKRWRFVPARRGKEDIEAWVLVPIVFRLESAS